MNYYLIVIVCMLSSALFGVQELPSTIAQLAPSGTVRPSPFRVLPGDIKGMVAQKLIHEHPTLIEPVNYALPNLGEIYSSALTSDGKMALIGYFDGTARLWDLSDPVSPKQQGVLSGHTHAIRSVALTQDGKVALTASINRPARLWDLSNPASPKQLTVLSSHAGAVSSVVALTADGKGALIGSWDGTVSLWDLSNLTSPKQQGVLSGHTDAISSIAFTQDGKIALTGSLDETARLWDLSNPSSPKLQGVLSGHTDAISSIAFAQDGKLALTGSLDGTARLWDLSNPSSPKLLTVLSEDSSVWSVALAQDGKVALTGAANGRVRLWDLGNLARIRTRILSGRTENVSSVALTPDGKGALTIDDVIAQFWDLIPRMPLEEVQKKITDDVLKQREKDRIKLLKVFDNPKKLLKLLKAIYGDSQLGAHRDLRNQAGETLLMKLIEYRDLYVDSAGIFDATVAANLLRYLVANSDVNAADDRGETALIKATKKSDLSDIKLLLDRGAHIFHKDTSGKSAFDYSRGKPEIEEFFVYKLWRTIGKPRGDVNARDVRGETLLIAATKRGDVDAVGSLLALDADPFIEDSTGATAFVYARGNPAMEHLFADKLKVAVRDLFPPRQMGVNSQDERGETALIAATKHRDSRGVASLLSQGADPFIQDATKKTALNYARGNSALEKLFAQALHQTVQNLFPPQEFDINVRNEQGETALIAATKRGDVAVVKSLLALDADPFMEDTNKKTALDYARGNPEMEQAFAEKLGVVVQELSAWFKS